MTRQLLLTPISKACNAFLFSKFKKSLILFFLFVLFLRGFRRVLVHIHKRRRTLQRFDKSDSDDRTRTSIVHLEAPLNFSPGLYQLGESIGTGSFGGTTRRCFWKPTYSSDDFLDNVGPRRSFGEQEALVALVVPRANLDLVCRTCGMTRAGSKGAQAHHSDITNMQRKVEVLTELDHWNIATLRHFVIDETSIYLVSERPEGHSLLSWFVDQSCYCGEVLARSIVSEILLALVYLQNRRVVHCNLRLESVVISRVDVTGNVQDANGDLRATLCDFDFAKILPVGSTEIEAPQDGSLMYAAPEVLSGVYHLHTDCFSVGVVLFILLVSSPPFVTSTKQAYLKDVCSGDWNSSATRAGASSVVRDLLFKLLTPCCYERRDAMTMLRHRWIANSEYAAASDRMYGGQLEMEKRRDRSGVESLRFLNICGTLIGGPSSLSLSPSECQFQCVIEESGDE